MKRIVVILLSVLIAGTSFAQGKLVKSSDPKAPIWLKKDVNEYEAIKVRQESNVSLQDAEAGAFAQLRDNVVKTTVAYMLRTTVGDKDEAAIRKSVENSSYVKNISEAASLDTYWEIRFDKRSKMNYYNYNILYYFNEMEMKKIALEINQGKTKTAIDF
jgi:hypothetical protein